MSRRHAGVGGPVAHFPGPRRQEATPAVEANHPTGWPHRERGHAACALQRAAEAMGEHQGAVSRGVAGVQVARRGAKPLLSATLRHVPRMAVRSTTPPTGGRGKRHRIPITWDGTTAGPGRLDATITPASTCDGWRNNRAWWQAPPRAFPAGHPKPAQINQHRSRRPGLRPSTHEGWDPRWPGLGVAVTVRHPCDERSRRQAVEQQARWPLVIAAVRCPPSSFDSCGCGDLADHHRRVPAMLRIRRGVVVTGGVTAGRRAGGRARRPGPGRSPGRGLPPAVW